MFALTPLITHDGVPAFQQDWLWPVHQAQCSAFMSFGFSPWNPSGNGGAQVYPQPWWPYLLAGPLCKAIGPHSALAAQLIFYFLLGGCSIAVMVSRWTRNPLAAISAIAIYLGNPVLLNMLHAGHLHFLASYSVFPLLLAVLIDDRVKNNVLLVGVLAGLASAQQQFFLFAVVAIFAASLRNGLPWFVLRGVASILIGALFLMPQWCIALVDTQTASLLVYRPLIAWERAQSAPLIEAVRALGYIGLYDQLNLSVLMKRALWIYPLLSIIGLAAHWRKRTTWIWATLLLTGMVAVTGLNGPLAQAWQWAFLHVAATGFVRELYNAAALIMVAYAGATASAISSFPKRLFYLRAIACGLLVITSAAICGQYARNFSYFVVTAAGDAAISQIASARGASRYLTVPGISPMQTARTLRGGASPFLIPIGTHPSALSDLADFPNTYFALNGPNTLNALFLRRAGISHVLSIPGVRSVVDIEPSLRSVLPTPLPSVLQTYRVRYIDGGGRLSINRFSGVAASIARSYNGTAILFPLESGKPLQLYNPGEAPDPRTSWARTAFWKTLPTWAYTQPPGIFTVAKSKPLISPPADYVIGDATGQVFARGCIRSKRIDEHFVLLRCAPNPVIHGNPPIVLSRIIIAPNPVTIPAVVRQSGAKPTLRIDQFTSWKIRAMVNIPAGYALVFYDQYDAGWVCEECGVHITTDGFANAWIPRQPLRGVVTLTYRPAFLYFSALAVSFLLLLAAGLSICWTPRFLRADIPPGGLPRPT